MTSPTGVVLTGGASRRMGVDKATMVVDGRPLAVAVADALWEGGCAQVVCQGGDAHRLGEFGLTVLPDRSPGDGPLPAIADALEWADGPVVTAACDLVDLDAPTVRLLIERGVDGAIVAASTGDGAHLVAYWPPDSAHRLRAEIAAGVRSFRSVLTTLRAELVVVPDAVVRNVNTPDDVV